MATAPKPGGNNAPTYSVLKITVRGETTIVDPGDFGPKDDIMVRKESLAAFGERMSLMGAFHEIDERSAGTDTICLLWWIGRRKAGETNESLSDALDSFPTYAEMAQGAYTAEVVEPEDDSGN